MSDVGEETPPRLFTASPKALGIGREHKDAPDVYAVRTRESKTVIGLPLSEWPVLRAPTLSQREVKKAPRFARRGRGPERYFPSPLTRTSVSFLRQFVSTGRRERRHCFSPSGTGVITHRLSVECSAGIPCSPAIASH
jgi:hypothetical protein